MEIKGKIEPVSCVMGGPISPKEIDLTDAATIATDASLGNHFRVTLGGNRTLGAPANPTDGQRCIWEFTQDGGGSRVLTLNSVFSIPLSIVSVTLSITAGTTDMMEAIYNFVKSKWIVVGFIKGY